MGSSSAIAQTRKASIPWQVASTSTHLAARAVRDDNQA